MGRVRLERKIKDGKLVKIDVEFDGSTIKSIRITGDFFIYPEESIVCVENAMVGRKVYDVERFLEKVFEENCEEVIGFSWNDIADMIAEAYRIGGDKNE